MHPGLSTGVGTIDPVILAAAMRTHVERLAADIGERSVFHPSPLDAARKYIAGEWRSQGYRVATQWYDVGRLRCANVEASRLGSSRPPQILLVGAHYDSVSGSPGANDNASGVAALLELSRLFAAVTPQVKLRFVAFANEELRFFLSRQQDNLARDARAGAERERRPSPPAGRWNGDGTADRNATEMQAALRP